MTQKIDKVSHSVLVKGRAEMTENKRIVQSLHYSTIEGAFSSASGSIYNAYIVPFAMSLRATSGEIGILVAAQNLAATLSQLPGAMLTQYYSRKAIWLVCQIISRIIIWIPIIALSLFNFAGAVTILIGLIFIQTFFVNLRNPAWTSLMGDLVPQKMRGHYFGSRNVILGVAGMTVTLVAGIMLNVYGFSSIFAIYVLLSIIAIPFFMKIYETPVKRSYHYRHRIALHPSDWPKAIKTNRGLSIFTAYLILMNFAIIVAAPFYTVYMIRDLGFDYTTFAVLTVLGTLARILSFKYWGRLNDKYGSRKIFIVVSSMGIFVPLLWIFVSDPITAVIVIIYDGLIFSGFDQVAFNYLLDITPADRRPQYVANHNFFVGLGVFFGAITGGALAGMVEDLTFLVLAGLQIIFLVSFMIRIGALSLLLKINEINISHMDAVPVRYVFWTAMAVEPIRGINNALHYTFRYPYKIEKEFKKDINAIKYKIKIKTA